MSKALVIFTDGGARGNPGPAAIGVIIKNNQGKILVKFGKYIGRATNNVAEYMAVIEALKWIKTNFQFSIPKESCKAGIFNFQFFLDSKLVVGQLNGIFKIKNKNLRDLIIEVRKLEQEIGGNVRYNSIPREKNKKADFLVNFTLNKMRP